MKENSKPIRKLADELGVSENNLYTWRKQLREKADNAFSNQPRFDEKELEIRRLKVRVSELEEEREILLVPFGWKKPPRFSQKRKVSDLRDDKAAIGFP